MPEEAAAWKIETFRYAQGWFWYNAKQRYDSIQLFAHQFFIVPLLAVAALVASAVDKLAPYRAWVCLGAIALSIVSMAVTRLFQRLEARNLELVTRGSVELAKFESDHCDWGNIDDSRRPHGFILPDSRRSGTATGGNENPSHKETFKRFFDLAYAVHGVIAIFAVLVLTSTLAQTRPSDSPKPSKNSISSSEEGAKPNRHNLYAGGGDPLNPIIFLAGSVNSDWRRGVKSALPKLAFCDPRETGLTSPSEYKAWNLFWLSKSAVLFAYMERDNPSGYGLALEIGHARAEGKFVILVDERSAHDKTFADQFAWVHEVADVSFDDLRQGISYLSILMGPGSPTRGETVR